MFSLVKTFKTKLRTNLLTSTLNDPLEISIEGPPLSSFNASAAVTVNLWWTDTSSTRRVNQAPRKEYRPRAAEDDTEDDVEEDTDSL